LSFNFSKDALVLIFETIVQELSKSCLSVSLKTEFAEISADIISEAHKSISSREYFLKSSSPLSISHFDKALAISIFFFKASATI